MLIVLCRDVVCSGSCLLSLLFLTCQTIWVSSNNAWSNADGQALLFFNFLLKVPLFIPMFFFFRFTFQSHRKLLPPHFLRVHNLSCQLLLLLIKSPPTIADEGSALEMSFLSWGHLQEGHGNAIFIYIDLPALCILFSTLQSPPTCMHPRDQTTGSDTWGEKRQGRREMLFGYVSITNERIGYKHKAGGHVHPAALLQMWAHWVIKTSPLLWA